MNTFMVGGAVRDKIMGIKPNDEDFVVVGSTPEEMLEKGFAPVGADFPVFLDKEGREFALARTERKTGPGHTGFDVTFDPDVTLEEDTKRRDFTMNAIAMDDSGTIIDPHNGQQDIIDGTIRHVSDAFLEDPLRVLRAARFAAQLGFVVADETMELMKEMVTNGDLNNLTIERVFKELEKAMATDSPHVFFNVLRETGAHKIIFPGITSFDWGNPKLRVVANKTTNSDLRWTALASDMSPNEAETFINKVKPPKDIMGIFRFTSKFFNCDDINEFLLMVSRFGLPRNQFRLATMEEFIQMTVDIEDHSDKLVFIEAMHKASEVSFADLSDEQQHNLEGPEIGLAIKELRRSAIESIIGEENVCEDETL